jgi:hypothetical protein
VSESLRAAPGGASIPVKGKDAALEEYLLLGNPNRGAGEPWVAVNPKASPQWPSEHEARSRGSVRASHDQGKPCLIYPDRYPQAGERFEVCASHSLLIMGYLAGNAAGERCLPCIVFGISRDDGRSA